MPGDGRNFFLSQGYGVWDPQPGVQIFSFAGGKGRVFANFFCGVAALKRFFVVFKAFLPIITILKKNI